MVVIDFDGMFEAWRFGCNCGLFGKQEIGGDIGLERTPIAIPWEREISFI